MWYRGNFSRSSTTALCPCCASTAPAAQPAGPPPMIDRSRKRSVPEVGSRCGNGSGRLVVLPRGRQDFDDLGQGLTAGGVPQRVLPAQSKPSADSEKCNAHRNKCVRAGSAGSAGRPRWCTGCRWRSGCRPAGSRSSRI
jgi:hypothetical protein